MKYFDLDINKEVLEIINTIVQSTITNSIKKVISSDIYTFKPKVSYKFGTHFMNVWHYHEPPDSKNVTTIHFCLYEIKIGSEYEKFEYKYKIIPLLEKRKHTIKRLDLA